ncbi:MAG TPA: AraC family transcriptional regulator [Kofleriaceae bacterium]
MRRPKDLSQTPATLDVDEPRRDVLADLLSASLLRNAIYRRIDCGAPWGIKIRERQGVRFYVVVRGSARFEVEGEPRHDLSVGDVIFLPRGTAHVVRDAASSVPEVACEGHSNDRCTAGRGVVRRIGGDGARASLLLGNFELSGAQPVLLASLPRVLASRADDPARSATMAATVQMLIAESTADGPASTFVLQRLAEILLVHSLRELAAHSAGDPRKLAAIADPAIHNSLELMHRGLAQPWTVASLAKRVGMSRSTFAERFTSLVGEPPLQYLARWRMARAGELLRANEARVNEVAAHVGYASVPSFNKAFRKWQGASPTKFRIHV